MVIVACYITDRKWSQPRGPSVAKENVTYMTIYAVIKKDKIVPSEFNGMPQKIIVVSQIRQGHKDKWNLYLKPCVYVSVCVCLDVHLCDCVCMCMFVGHETRMGQ